MVKLKVWVGVWVSRDKSVFRKSISLLLHTLAPNCFVIPLGFEPRTHALKGRCSTSWATESLHYFKTFFASRLEKPLGDCKIKTHYFKWKHKNVTKIVAICCVCGCKYNGFVLFCKVFFRKILILCENPLFSANFVLLRREVLWQKFIFSWVIWAVARPPLVKWFKKKRAFV